MKADIFEGVHHVPFIVEWPNKGAKNTITNNTIGTTDFFATCAEITGYNLAADEAEDSYSMLPLITGESNNAIREYIVYSSINGSFAIKQGDWKLSACPGSGGWSYPKPKDIIAENLDLPAMQLYNIKEDVSEMNNLIAEHPKKAAELKKALKKIIFDGRSTAGAIQQNDAVDGWSQIKVILE
ncbi:hypothetical protein [Formosa sp. PL04]|uniref:hypothetical protein n=1 Tax=Formosa sp. PL04 TaxID=3081755 RepID=UPI00298191C5|nr:hypothetical protein [Formosa sp. PL04]MDW5291009.1 hypothetical protein [Formosa sp. PL04]